MIKETKNILTKCKHEKYKMCNLLRTFENSEFAEDGKAWQHGQVESEKEGGSFGHLR